jgi:hypothetical protein
MSVILDVVIERKIPLFLLGLEPQYILSVAHNFSGKLCFIPGLNLVVLAVASNEHYNGTFFLPHYS